MNEMKSVRVLQKAPHKEARTDSVIDSIQQHLDKVADDRLSFLCDYALWVKLHALCQEGSSTKVVRKAVLLHKPSGQI